MSWRTRHEGNDAVIRAALERDRDWAAYLLGDLEPPYRQHARFFLASRANQDEAVLLLYEPPEFQAIGTTGEAEGIAVLFERADALPAGASLSIPESHRAIVERHYTVDRWRTMWRMALGRSDLRLPPGYQPVTVLTLRDFPAIEALLAYSPGTHFFTAPMLADGMYYGVWSGADLLAVAGTHVIAPASRVAAIGNVFTHPAARGQGLATATTAAVAQALFEGGCERVVLNVEASNTAAIRIYVRLGFQAVRSYIEADYARRRV